MCAQVIIIWGLMLFFFVVFVTLLIADKKKKKQDYGELSGDYKELDALCKLRDNSKDYGTQVQYDGVIEVRTDAVRAKEEVNIQLYKQQKTLEAFNNCCNILLSNPLLLKYIHQSSDEEGVRIIGNAMGLETAERQKYQLPLKQAISLIKNDKQIISAC